MNPYKELISFIVSHISPEAITNFKASEDSHDHFYELLSREKAGIATEEERKEIDKFMEMEHLVRMIKIQSKKSVHVAQS